MIARLWSVVLFAAAVAPLGDTAKAAEIKAATPALVASIQPEKAEFLVGEPIFITLTVENKSDKDVEISEGGRSQNSLGRDEHFKITASDAAGKAVPGVELGWVMGGGLTWRRPLPAHGKMTTAFFLPDWVQFKAEGEYRIRLESHQFGGFIGLDFSEETSIKVLPKDAVKMGAMIDGWGKTLASAKPHDFSNTEGLALKKLCFVDDERAIPHLARLSDKPLYQSEAIRALAKFPTVKAVAALKKAGEVSENDLGPNDTSATTIRHWVALTLASNTHPAARETLIDMRKDSFEPVRALAMEAMARNPSSADLAILETMTHDQDQGIANEATHFLEKARSAATQPQQKN